jgi:hypothetical protein
VAKVSNGDSDSDQDDPGPSESGTNFTVDPRDLRQIELTGEQRDAISSDIIDVIIASVGKPNPPEIIVLFDPDTKVTKLIDEKAKPYGKYMAQTSFAPPD